MRLRRQLLFISLVTLALPWAGCQYIKEMDKALRQGQADALEATARAVSARLSSERNLLQELSSLSGTTSPFYAHPLRSPVVIDGYDDDWQNQGINTLPLDRNGQVAVSLGIWRDRLYLLIRSEAEAIEYFNPSNSTLAGSDHLVLELQRGAFALFASAPGELKVIRRMSSPPEVGDKNAEYRIKGHWLEWSGGYQLEISLPLSWGRQGLGILRQYADRQQPAVGVPLMPIIAHSTQLTRELEVFASSEVRMHITTDSGHIIATSGSLSFIPAELRQHGFLEWLYDLVLRTRALPLLTESFANGRIQTPDVRSALDGAIQHSRYQISQQAVTRTSFPVRSSANQVIGSIVVEQSSDSLANVTNNAFSRLLAYTFLASCFAAVCLVLYASWLSWRIRRLSRAARHAISDSGKIADDFPVSRRGDEIGELSRSYAQLLTRLREYTNYLRTLSSKLSHELRTPLAIVRSSLDNLEHERLNKQARTYAERAREGTTRLSNILNAMSAASRVEQAIGAAEQEVIPCDQLLRNLKEAYEDVYRHVCFKLNIRDDDKRGLEILGSGELLVQALDKLVDNAADFCPEQGLIELGLYRHQDYVVFTVRNEGPPLPSHMHGQLFDSMVSVRDKNAPDEGHHLGLGLYIVRLITDFHNGEVQGYNVPDHSGVIFEVRLPATG